LCPQHFGFQKILGPQKFWVQKIEVQKNLGPKIWLKKILNPKKFGLGKYLVPKNFGFRRILSPNKFWVMKKLGPKILGREKS